MLQKRWIFKLVLNSGFTRILLKWEKIQKIILCLTLKMHQSSLDCWIFKNVKLNVGDMTLAIVVWQTNNFSMFNIEKYNVMYFVAGHHIFSNSTLKNIGKYFSACNFKIKFIHRIIILCAMHKFYCRGNYSLKFLK
jgi:hypothetical protein